MELRHFRCFAAVAETLHFARAAEQLGISPPALTKQIQEIERLLDVRLFQRTKRSVHLTSAGEVFREEVLRTLHQAARAEEAARRAGRGEIGRIEIGYIASAAYSGLLQTEVARFRSAYPLVKLNLIEAPMDSLPVMVSNGGMDLAFIRPPVPCPPDVAVLTLLYDDFVAALPEDSPLAQKEILPAADLAAEQFILPEQASGTMEVGRRGRFVPRTVANPGGLVAVITLVSLGQGVAIVPVSVMQRVHMPGVVYRQIEGKSIPGAIALASRRHEKSPVVRAFLKQLKSRQTA
ncbi:transcriptional regulator [Herbaspirillum sp. CF444]|uniref:LysR family transcriptional regulator n=1 Tax=Herbaspirillum sp. CF444 TaxID=1144319 RepID=UPI0002725E05|nr:LysR family transcriptional regulator [Herbaspirillum sp. CF444]EJL82872.1 transcriptional regulator [Herbaspirillum sp. CF444]